MRAIALLVALIFCVPAHALELIQKAPVLARLLPVSSSISTTATCPTGKPSPDGSTIVPVVAGRFSCTLTDTKGGNWRYNASTLVRTNYGYSYGYDEDQINSGGKNFVRGLCSPNSTEYWYEFTGGAGPYPVISPTEIPSTKYFENLTTSTFYRSVPSMMSASSRGDRLEIKSMPAGLSAWTSSSYRITGPLTLTIDYPAKIYCSQDEGNAIFPIDDSGGAFSGVTIQGSRGLGELGYRTR